jgi:hypothetical protein
MAFAAHQTNGSTLDATGQSLIECHVDAPDLSVVHSVRIANAGMSGETVRCDLANGFLLILIVECGFGKDQRPDTAE